MKPRLIRLRRFIDNLPLRTALVLALLAGLAVPVGLAAVAHFTQQRHSWLARQHEDHARIVEVLALGMQTPLWEIRPEAGRALIEAVMLDERITAIEVSSPLLPAFLSARIPRQRPGPVRVLERPVQRGEETIGTVRVTMNVGLLTSRLTGQWLEMVASGLLQLFAGMGIMLVLLNYKVLGPVRRLVAQSRLLATGVLDRPLAWTRGDELGVLGRSFEDTRRALNRLMQHLDRRNRELQTREQELARQARIQQAILDNMTDGITLVDRDLNLAAWNRRFVELLELPEDILRHGIPILEVTRLHLERLGYDPRDRDQLLDPLRNSFRPGQATTTQTRRGGRHIEIRRSPVPDGGFVSTYTDVTHLRHMERELRDSERRFRSIAEAHPVPVIISALDQDRMLYASPGLADLIGAPVAAIVASPPDELFADPKDRAEIRRRLLHLGRVDSYECTLRRADGSTFVAAVTARRLDYLGTDAAVGGIIDLTERKRAEAEIARQREALHQSEKLSALGSLLAGVAHELNNPLSVVVGRAIMLEESAPQEVRSRVEKIRQAAERCARIVKTFLAIARQQPPQRVRVQINDLLAAAVALVEYGLRSSGVELQLDLADDLPPVSVDPDQFTQVFSNLAVNAQQALEEVADPRRLTVSSRYHPGRNTLTIRFTDNGPGVPRAIRSRIFEPFYTSKPEGVGTGVGLSFSHGVISSHGGTLHLEDAPGGGACFVIRLPVQPEQPDTLPDRAAVEPQPTHSRILLVDDEPGVIELLEEILSAAGHRVDSAVSGNQALNRIAEVRYDLILSDLKMPDLDGPGLFKRLQQDHPALAARVIFITGDTLSPETGTFLARSGRPLIEKPFVPVEVLRLVQRELRGKP